MASKVGVTLRGRFAPRTKVTLHARHGDVYNPDTAGPILDRGTVNKDGEIQFTGLDLGHRYWIAGDVDDIPRGVAMTAKPQNETVAKLSEAEVTERLAQTRPAVDDRTERITGARNSVTARATSRSGQPFAHPQVGKPTPKGDLPDEPNPHARQEDVKGPQRSDTITGQATPVNPNEIQPKIRQDQIRKGTPQRSATPLGEATPVDPGELQPGLPQKLEKGPQRSSTRLGQAEPIAKGSPRAQEEAKDSAESKAVGATVAKAGTDKTKGRVKTKAPVKKTAAKAQAPDPDKATE